MLKSPIIIHIPHSSTYIPASERRKILLSDAELRHELLAMTDWYVDELFDFGDFNKHINKYSRLVFDPERFRNDSDEVMAPKGMGAIYTKTFEGKILREITYEKKERMLKQYYDPYHEAVTQLVEKCVEQFGQCIILDAHSFSSKPLPYEIDQMIPRPPINIGSDHFHTPAGIPRLAYEFLFWGEDEYAAWNKPFEGTFVPMKNYHSDPRVKSFMVEINRSRYMDEESGNKLDSFEEFKGELFRFTQYITKEVFVLQNTQFKKANRYD